jgi:hypothetical protein
MKESWIQALRSGGKTGEIEKGWRQEMIFHERFHGNAEDGSASDYKHLVSLD